MDAQLTFPRIRASEGYLAYFPSQISVLSGLGEKGVRLVVLKQQLKVELTFLMELQNGIEEHRALDRFRAQHVQGWPEKKGRPKTSLKASTYLLGRVNKDRSFECGANAY